MRIALANILPVTDGFFRYTLTYTPADDRILPSPPALFVKIKNHRAIPLRAAYLRGPYNIYCAAYPSTFDPYTKDEAQEQDYGIPQFEPYLKPGAEWVAKLTIPEDIRETAETFARSSTDNNNKKSVTWVIEVVSQILFSLSASVNFEILVSRDERSLELGKIAVAGGYANSVGESAMDHQIPRSSMEGRSQKGVYSKAVKLTIDDTASLWDRPALPEWENKPANKRQQSRTSVRRSMSYRNDTVPKVTKQKKIHLVVLTHGIHSNVGADMLFVKESIDATIKQARENRKKRKRDGSSKSPSKVDRDETLRPRTATQDFAETEDRKQSVPDDGFWDGDGAASSDDEADGAETEGSKLTTVLSEDAITSEPESLHEHGQGETSTAPLTGGQEELNPDDDDEEEVVVRGFSGNVTHTEKGIQYLGKRLAKSLLEMTYPDQPYRAAKKSRKFSTPFSSGSSKDQQGADRAHMHSSIYKPDEKVEERAYRFTSISFVGHSLGGLVQLYAIGYIQKHSPEFFDHIKPVNFVAMASPFLGLSNENPVYVRFALDFGLVGRTGQDLGLTWRPPTLAKGLWDAVFQTEDKKKTEQPDPGSKPLLQILPRGPAHQVLKRFKNRTVYSNIVNDGIVPLRTSCLLFLDWRGLEKVDKARRENGLIGTVANWGWQEMTGANSSPHPHPDKVDDSEVDDADTPPDSKHSNHSHMGSDVPQPAEDTTNVDDEVQATAPERSRPSFEEDARRRAESYTSDQQSGSLIDNHVSPSDATPSQTKPTSNAFESFLNFFRPANNSLKPPKAQSTPKAQATPKPLAKGPPKLSKKDSRMFKRSQTLKPSNWDQSSSVSANSIPPVPPIPAEGRIPNREEGEHGEEAHFQSSSSRPAATRGDSLLEDPSAPPKTSFFESAGDLIAPPIPSQKWINDPTSRTKVIIHDRMYHPSDIPPPPTRKDTRTDRFFSQVDNTRASSVHSEHHPGGSSMDSTQTDLSVQTDTEQPGSMRVEEKIARAYHHDLSWRKVLVKLEPDAHNNMVVRRMFANAYGWPVVKHLCETHFAD